MGATGSMVGQHYIMVVGTKVQQIIIFSETDVDVGYSASTWIASWPGPSGDRTNDGQTRLILSTTKREYFFCEKRAWSAPNRSLRIEDSLNLSANCVK